MDSIDTLKTLLDSLNLDLDNKIISIKDLDTLEIYLKYYQVSGKTIKYQLKHLLEEICEENYIKSCKVIKLALELCPDEDCFNEVLSKLQDINTIIDLYLLKLLLDDKCASQELGTIYLESILTTVNDKNKVFYNYFVSQVLPSFIKFHHHDVIWKSVEASKNLNLICPIINEFLTNDILKLKNFWTILQEEFKTNYKVARYIFHEALKKLKNNTNFTSESCIINFTEQNKDSWFKAVEYLKILLEVAREKQEYYIEPVLLTLEKITMLHKTWLKLIYSILYNHPNNSIVCQSLIIQMRTSKIDDFNDILIALNKSHYSNLTKETFESLGNYILKMSHSKYEKLLQQSLKIRWVPVAFWCFNNVILTRLKQIELKTLEQIIGRVKILPNIYIRKGIMDLIFERIEYDITENNLQLIDLLDILIELLKDKSSQNYGFKILDSFFLVVDELVLSEMENWLKEEIPNVNKLILLVEIVSRLNVPNTWINEHITNPFLERKYNLVTLDRLTYIFCITGRQLENYLLHRLTIPDKAVQICLLDNSRSLANKCVDILTTNHPSHSLALEILFYLNECRFKHVYKIWIEKILKKEERIESDIALGFVNLLAKIPKNYIKSNSVKLHDILLVYDLFFSTQSNEVVVKIFKNLDFIFENSNNYDLLWFSERCVSQLVEMKTSDCFQDAVRYFIRALALSFNEINDNTLDFSLKKIYEMAEQSEVVAHYSMMYFKCLSISDESFPKYKFLLYGDVLAKNKIAEYEIYKTIYTYNPFFKAAEIRKWAVEDIILNSNNERITYVSKYLIENYKTNFNKRYFPNSQLHFQKLRIMQSLCFLLPLMSQEIHEELKTLIIDSFCTESHQPSVRQLMQYLLIQLLRNETNIIEETINNASKTTTSTITGFIPILYGLEMFKKDIDFSINIVEILLPWTMGAHFKLRLFSQLVIKKVCERNLTNRKFKLKYDGLFKSIQCVLKSTKQIDSGIINDLNFIEHFISEENSSSKLIYLISIYIPETTNVIPYEWEYFKMKYSYNRYISDKSENTQKTGIERYDNFQKKFIPWQEFLNTEKTNFILVTSLIDSYANLGGLSRTCEIFGVKQMVVNNENIVTNSEFKNLSMSSQKWLDIIVVKVEDLKEFLLRGKGLGYTVIGAEQASDSVSLEKYNFKEKTILLLGNEHSGIPPNLIPLLDVCIEIPQFGLVRSLNVHVAGAMFIWEYTKQRITQ